MEYSNARTGRFSLATLFDASPMEAQVWEVEQISPPHSATQITVLRPRRSEVVALSDDDATALLTWLRAA